MIARSLLLGCALLAAAAPAAFAQDMKMPRSISVTGHGEVRAAPDMAVVSIGVSSHAETARAALSANSEAMTRIMASLKTGAIPEKDIQTSNFSVQASYDFSNNAQPRLTGYDVSNSVSVMVRALEGLGALLDQVVSAGSNQINGITFAVSAPDAAMDKARELAAADALRKAKLYARSMSFQMGGVLNLTETRNFQPPMFAKDARMESMAADVPVAPGEQVLTVDVSITWAIE